MKNSDEMVKSLLERRDEYMAKKAKSKKAVRILAPVSCACLIALACVGVLRSGLTDAPVSLSPTLEDSPKSSVAGDETKTYNSGAESDSPSNAGAESDSPSTGNDINIPISDEAAFVAEEFYGKSVTEGLYKKLNEAKDDEKITIVAHPGLDWDFIYNGKSVNSYYVEYSNERTFRDVLGMLLKDGDYLKFGTALYETGTPDGEKWAKELYEERVKLYGDELLSKYIVDGEFLKEKLESDIAQLPLEIQDAWNAWRDSCEAYIAQIVSEFPDDFGAKVKGQWCFVLTLTKEEFKTFKPERAPDGWWYNLYSETFSENGGEPTVETANDAVR